MRESHVSLAMTDETFQQQSNKLTGHPAERFRVGLKGPPGVLMSCTYIILSSTRSSIVVSKVALLWADMSAPRLELVWSSHDPTQCPRRERTLRLP